MMREGHQAARYCILKKKNLAVDLSEAMQACALNLLTCRHLPAPKGTAK
jgi:hypothetical protein